MTADDPAGCPVNLSGRTALPPVTRRALLAGLGAGAGALVLGLRLGGPGAAELRPIALNAWLGISPHGAVILVDRSEMGQGVHTALPMLLADELDYPWDRIAVRMAPVGPAYRNPILGAMATGGSTSVRAGFLPLRRAGAAARIMLVEAAAALWRVDPADLVTADGEVRHPPSERAVGYGALAPLAARRPVPATIPLRGRADWQLIGRPIPRRDVAAKTDGRATFGIDVRVPGMVYAAIRQCPTFGGTLAAVDTAALTEAERAEVRLVQLPDAVAVVADGWWRARRTLDRLAIRWDRGANASNHTDAIRARLTAALGRAGTRVVDRGDVDAALAGAARRLDADYHLPLVAHLTPEPMTATAEVTAERCTLWVPTQAQSLYREVLPDLLGLAPDAITVNTTYLGGGFGRRFEADFGIQAALIARAVGRPVQLIWDRAEDVRHDFYRPAHAGRVTVALGAEGEILGWHHRVAGPSIMARALPQMMRDDIDMTTIEGLHDQPYALPALRIDAIRQEVGVPVGFWRSVGHAINAFVLESMLDEVAHATGRDPFALRRALLAGAPRHRRVLERLAEVAGWHDRPLAPVAGARRGRGLALHGCFGTIVGEVCEVTVFDDGRLAVDRVVAVIDCATVINPETVDGQVRGGIIFGLSAALAQAITIQDGAVVETGYRDHPVLTLADSPEIEVELLKSDAAIGGVGEPATPPIAPALTNAIFAATGRRLRSLPVAAHDVRAAAPPAGVDG